MPSPTLQQQQQQQQRLFTAATRHVGMNRANAVRRRSLGIRYRLHVRRVNGFSGTVTTTPTARTRANVTPVVVAHTDARAERTTRNRPIRAPPDVYLRASFFFFFANAYNSKLHLSAR